MPGVLGVVFVVVGGEGAGKEGGRESSVRKGEGMRKGVVVR